MTQTTVRPRGRRPGHDDTRGTIARAALALFTAGGYDSVSMRAIAREADVDPALVHHYFTSKAQLFATVVLEMDLDVDAMVETIIGSDPAGIGLRAAKAYLSEWDPEARRSKYLQCFKSSLDDGERRCLNEFIAREVFARVGARMGHANPVLRGQLAVSAMVGVMVSRHVLRFPILGSTSVRSLYEPLGRTLQYYLVEEW